MANYTANDADDVNVITSTTKIYTPNEFRDYCNSIIDKYGYRIRTFPVLALIEKIAINDIPGNEYAIRTQYNIARWINVSLTEGFIETEIRFDTNFMRENIIGFVLKETPNDTIMKILDEYHVYINEE